MKQRRVNHTVISDDIRPRLWLTGWKWLFLPNLSYMNFVAQNTTEIENLFKLIQSLSICINHYLRESIG